MFEAPLTTCTGARSMVWASIRASAVRKASHAEQSAPPEGTMIELLPLGLRWKSRSHISMQAGSC